MKLRELLPDVVGLALVHWDPALGLACFWNGNVAFLEYRLTPYDDFEHGSSWFMSQRPATLMDALDVARSHYGQWTV